MLLCNMIIFSVLKNVIYSTLISLMKFLFFYLYFIYFIDVIQYNLKDDLRYFMQSRRLYEYLNGDVWSVFSARGILYASGVAGGFHFGYYIINIFAFKAFGIYYYAPILFNLPISVLAAVFMYKTFILSGISKKAARLFFVFFLLHWDLLAWQSFFNLKDSFVLFMTTVSIYNILYLRKKGFNLWNLLGLIITLALFNIIRFYYCYFLLVVILIYILFNVAQKIESRWKSVILKFLILIVLPIGFYVAFNSLFTGSLEEMGSGRTNFLIGSVRYLITPFPLNISEDYRFLRLASTLHWLTLPFMLYGFYILVSRYFKELAPWIVLFVMIAVFYGSFAELQGPRHRIPMIAVISVCQFLGIWEFLKFLKTKRGALSHSANN